MPVGFIITSSISIGPPLSSAERSPKRTSTRCNRRNPAHSAFRFSHSQTAIDASHAAQYSQPHASRIMRSIGS